MVVTETLTPTPTSPPLAPVRSDIASYTELSLEEAMPMKLKRILAPIDFSPDSAKALKYATRLAQQFDAQLLLLHVTEPLIYASDFMPPGEMYNWEVSMLQEITGKLTAAQATVTTDKQKKIGSEIHVRTGVAHHEITQAAQTLEADLIVISTHGRSGLPHMLMGSTAERVVQHAPCPVLVVRQNERDFVPNA